MEPEKTIREWTDEQLAEWIDWIEGLFPEPYNTKRADHPMRQYALDRYHAANSPRPNRTSGQETTLVAERPGPPVAVMVSLPGPRAPHGPLRYLRLVGALLDAIHGAGKGAGHSFGVGHRVDPPRLPSAGGTHHWFARLGERASLLERPTIPTEKVVDRHLLSPLLSAVVRPQIRGCDLTTTTAFAPIRPLQQGDHGFGSLS